ncbi:MAG: PKD domain-containing protein [Desulfobacteraceae bacterium]|nr:PKD domain-containing protein [Desulfobacteraceae bacterium]
MNFFSKSEITDPTNKIKIVFITFCALFLLFTNSSRSYASDIVRVFLMAGQSNMEGNNTKISALQKLLCHAGEFSMEGEICNSNDINTSELTSLFLDTVESDYNLALANQQTTSVIDKLQDFLCSANRLQTSPDCGNMNFDLGDRVFKTISEYYYNGTSYAYGYDAFKHMSTATGLSDIYNDGLFTTNLLNERSDVSVLMFSGSHDSSGNLSLSERYGNLSPIYGSQTSNYGPELLFGHYMGNYYDDDVLLLKVVQGGTSLRLEWRSPGVEANTANNYTAEELNKESLYTALLEKAQLIQQSGALESYFPQYAGKTVVIEGIIWFQGWNDGIGIAAENYEDNFTAFIQDLRNDLARPEIPIVVAQSHRGEGDSLVQLAQANVAMATENMEMAVTEDLSGYYHFDSAAHPVIGKRMADTIKPMLTSASNWTGIDIGDVGLTGSSTINNQIHTINGSGHDIWGNIDAFRYVYQTLNGNGSITARVESLSDTHEWAKAGIMIRDTLEPGSKHAALVCSSSRGLAFQWRVNENSYSNYQGTSGAAPVWLRLQRDQDELTALYSEDGNNWTIIGTKPLPMTQQLYIGLCVTAHDNTKMNTAVFNQVAVEPGLLPTHPVADFLLSPANGYSPLSVSFDGSQSKDFDGSVTQYQWDFGDGQTGSGKTINHSYNSPGTYSVTLLVTDNDGNTHQITKTDCVTATTFIDTAALCAAAGANCGLISDGQGGTADCGSCSGSNVCVSNRCEPACDSSQLGGPIDNLFFHLPNHIAPKDISGNNHPVTMTQPMATAWVSKADITDKTITIDLNNNSLSAPFTISFKMIPTINTQNETLISNPAFQISDGSGTINSTFNYTGGGGSSISNTASSLKTNSCNHLALVIGDNFHQNYLNGELSQTSITTDNLKPIDGIITIGPYPGKIWDLRIYNRTLSAGEVLELADVCADTKVAADRFEGYPNYMSGVYVTQWWPDGVTDVTQENLDYYIHKQDEVYERHILDTGMYPVGNLCDYLVVDSGKNLMLSEGIRNGFVKNYTFDNPAGQYWLHENFHSFQGRLKGYNGFGGSKFLLESTASWGADSIYPGCYDTLLGYYTLQPHQPLWTTQSSPIEEGVVDAFKGGHQYGAYIFEAYLTRYVVSNKLIGDIYNDTRAGSESARVMYEKLEQAGFDMKDVFMDFAARTITWDYENGELYLASEIGSYNRMVGANNNSSDPWPAEDIDNKIAVSYSENGTGDTWTSVPSKYKPGSWAYNAYKMDVTNDKTYFIGLMTDATNPTYAEFRARVVIHHGSTGIREYHPIDPASPGLSSTIQVSANAGDKLYLVVCVTPSTIFSGWDTYLYQYKINPIN